MEVARKRQANGSLSTSSAKTSHKNHSPFDVFPEELWAMILGYHVNELSTLQTIYAAIPELVSALRGRITTLEFMQVSPGVWEYQPTREYRHVLSKIIDRDWCESLYHFLRMPKTPPVLSYYLPVTHDVLSTRKSLTALWEIQDLHKRLKAARKFHSLNLTFMFDEGNSLDYFKACLDLLSDFGTSVRTATLTVHCPTLSEGNALFNRILNVLEKLPNGCSLSIEVKWGSAFTLGEAVRQCTYFPGLPRFQQLEILAAVHAEKFLLQYFLNGGYIGKGGVKTLLLRARKDCIVKYKLDTKRDIPKDMKQFKKLTMASQVRKSVKPTNICPLTPLFQWLSSNGHRGVEELIIDNRQGTILCPAVGQPLATLPGVKYLKVSDSSITGFQFLCALPALQYLHVEGRPETKAWFLNGEMDAEAFKDEPLARLVRNYLYVEPVPNECNIWETLPALRVLVFKEEGNVAKHFTRDNGNKPVIFKNAIELVRLE